MQMIAMALAGTVPHPNQTHAQYMSSPAYVPNYNFYHTASQNASASSFNFSDQRAQHFMSKEQPFCAQKSPELMFDHNSKLACHVHGHHHHMDFENVEVVGHQAHYHQRLFLEASMSVKDPNAGNDHMVLPEVYKCLARI